MQKWLQHSRFDALKKKKKTTFLSLIFKPYVTPNTHTSLSHHPTTQVTSWPLGLPRCYSNKVISIQ